MGGHGGRTIHRRHDADIVARTHLAVLAAKALECGAFCFWQKRFVFCGLRKSIVMGQFAHDNIVLMHPITCFNGILGKPDDLSEFADWRARCNGGRSHFMSAHHLCTGHHSLKCRLSLFDNTGRHQNIIGGI